MTTPTEWIRIYTAVSLASVITIRIVPSNSILDPP